MLDIPPDIFDRAYNHVANSALWFVHHLLLDTPNQPQFGHEFRRDWESYLVYNEAFAGALTRGGPVPESPVPESPVPGSWAGAPAVRRPPRILIQDYHLCLAPRMLRDRLGEAARDIGIAHFSHTPWAPPDYYRMLPGRGGPGAALRHARGPTRLASTPPGGPPRSWTVARPSSART